MRTIKIEKAALLAVVKKNREIHMTEVLKAQEAYRAKAIKELEAQLKRAQAGEKFLVHISLITPVDMTKVYDRVIRQLEMEVEDVVELTDTEFQNYVMDDWSWKHDALTSNSAYLNDRN